MKKTTKCAEYRYDQETMRRIAACGYLYAASTPAIATYAEENGVCIGHAAVRYVIGAVHRMMSLHYAGTFNEGLQIVEDSQVRDQQWRRGKVIQQLDEEYAAAEPEGSDRVEAEQELKTWLCAQTNAGKKRIREIAGTDGDLTEEQYHAAQYLLRSGAFKGRITVGDLVYLIREYLGPDAA
jgi:hypothetical protein